MLIVGVSLVMFFSLEMLVVEALFDPFPLLMETDGDLFRLIDKRPLEGFEPVESEGTRSRGWLPFGFAALASFCKKVGAMTSNQQERS